MLVHVLFQHKFSTDGNQNHTKPKLNLEIENSVFLQFGYLLLLKWLSP